MFHNISTARVKSLVYSIYDGFFYSLMVGFGETYFSAYALYLGANNFQMGVLSCLPPFLAGLCQFFTVWLLRKFPSRKKLVTVGVFFQGLALIPLMLTSNATVLRLEIYILLVTIYLASNNTVGPIWNSWMGDLVSVAQRGIYFGRRNKFVTIGTFLSMTTAGFILRSGKNSHYELYGFYIIFFLAFVSRMISCRFLSLKYDPPGNALPPINVGFIKFCRELPGQNYGYLILSMVTVNLGVYVAAAYFTPYMLKNLKMDYVTYTVVISAALFFKYISSGFWGEVIDKIGPKKVMVITSFLICFTALPWLYFTSTIPLFLAQCYTGIVWAGYELSTFTFLLDATKPEERAQVSSFYNILNTTSGFVGGVWGAVFVAFSVDSVHAFKILFASTALIRFASFFAFSAKLRETRILAPVKTSEVFLKASGFKSTLGMTARLVVFAKGKRSVGS